MKKQTLLLVLSILLSFAGLNAQQKKSYNRWSIDFNGGINIPGRSFSPGYFSKIPNLWSANGGVRYMFNNKFGLRLGGGYDKFRVHSSDAEPVINSTMWNVNLQGVANLGRMFAYEDWTERFNLLGHFGMGYAQFRSESFTGADERGIFIVGLTPQIRLSDRISFLFDVSMHTFVHEHYTFDGVRYEQNLNDKPWGHTNFNGLNVTLTAGLQIALGGKNKHADWYTAEKEKEEEEKAKQNEKTLENQISRPTDNKKLDQEKGDNTAGVSGVGGNGDTNIVNNNYNNSNNASGNGASDAARQLIEQGYLNAYFSFNSSKPQEGSMWAIAFVANYLRQNPDAKLNIIGYTDEVGNTGYNQNLSKKRADNIKQLLVEMGIDSSRMSSQGKGMDKSNSSEGARQSVRRVAFELVDSRIGNLK